MVALFFHAVRDPKEKHALVNGAHLVRWWRAVLQSESLQMHLILVLSCVSAGTLQKMSAPEPASRSAGGI